MNIDIKPIHSELQELAGDENVKIRLDKHMEIAASVKQDDRGYSIRLNPARIRGPKQLENHLNMCREAVGS